MNGHLRLLLQMVSKVHGAWIFLFRFLHNATASKVARCFVSRVAYFSTLFSLEESDFILGDWHVKWITHITLHYELIHSEIGIDFYSNAQQEFSICIQAQGANQKIVPRSHFLEINCSNFPPSANLNQVIVDPLTPYMQGKHPPFNPKSLSLLTHNTSTTYTVLLPFAKLFWHEEVNSFKAFEKLLGSEIGGRSESWALLPSL